MHELSIAQNILEIASAACGKSGHRRVDSVHIRIGRASGIMPDALLFAFEAIRGEFTFPDATLQIEEVPVSGQCRTCKQDFLVVEEYILSCPVCGGNDFSVTGGREMDVVDIEVS